MLENLWIFLGNWISALLLGLGLQPGLVDLVMVVLQFVLIVAIVSVNALILVWMERKVCAFIQVRLGPNRLGPFGLLQSMADAIKLLSKEDIVPAGVDKHLFLYAPIAYMTVAVLLYLVLPFGRSGMSALNLNLGLFYFLAIGSLTTVCLVAAGWGSHNKYSLLGSLRAVAQMISYELPLTFSLLGVIMIVGSLNLNDILAAQSHLWLVVLQPLGFVIFMIAAVAELERKPFDLPEGEQELTAGPYTEYSGMRYAIFFLAEYTYLFAVCGLAVTVYLGGGSGPLLPSWIWFFIKVYVLMWIVMWVGWTFPRIRIDRLMSFSWKVLIPLSLVNMFLTGVGLYIFKGLGA